MLHNNCTFHVDDVVFFGDHAGFVKSCIKADDKLLLAIELLRFSGMATHLVC